MKIVKAKEMARIEQLAYGAGASEEAFMNAAGEGVAGCIQEFIGREHLKPNIALLCGRGNNAGDAFVAGRILHEGGFHVVAYTLASFEESSPLCQLQTQRFKEAGGTIHSVTSVDAIDLEGVHLIIDGILGTGFHGQVEGLFKAVIEAANQANLPILSIDIPSGIDGNHGVSGGVAIEATHTVFLGLPKTGSFLGDAWNHVGTLSIFDFGLRDQFIAEAEADFVLITDELIESIFPPIVRNRHKYEAGYVVGLGGSPGMPGAPIMSSFAALKAGAGIVRLLHPDGMESELAAAPFEVIRQGYKQGDIQSILEAMSRANATFVGPGIGTADQTVALLKTLLPAIDKPCVIDAEALTILAHHKIELPKETILTPHHGEMKRLLGIEGTISMPELYAKSHAYAEKHQLTLVLKGAPTVIFHPGKTPHLCARGDAGMATAGSGDVLTGIIAAFLAQTHRPFHAAILGVQIHAIAGEHAAETHTSSCMTATDIIDALPSVFFEEI